MGLENIQGQLEQGEPCTFVALGDSLTKGWMVSRGYVDFLTRMIPEKYPQANLSIKNKGIEGHTAEDGLGRLKRDVFPHHPDLVLIQFGLNDCFMGDSPDVFESSLHLMVEALQKNTRAEILLLTSCLVFDARESLRANTFYERVISTGEHFDIPVARVHEYWRHKIEAGTDHGSLVQFDRVHPTELGHHLMAEAIMEVL